MVNAGVPNSAMPAFGAEQGGRLSGDQIESLAKTLTEKFPSKVPAVSPVKLDAIKP